MTQRSTLPPDVVAASQRLKEKGAQVYVVGGAVRDLLIGKRPGDFDLATNFHPDAVAACFPFSVPTGVAHGTISVWLNNRGQGPGIEITTYRGESTYSDGRRPDHVTFMAHIEDDLSRRDFTINAMAMDPFTLAVVDPFGGAEDAKKKVIRAVGNPQARFNEDGLRSMRAVRFSACLEFALEADTQKAIGETLANVRRVSAERIRDEFLKLLTAKRPSIGLDLMRETGLLSVVLPELLEGIGMSQNHHHAHTVYEHILAAVDAASGRTGRLAALFHDIAKPRTRAEKPDHPGEHTFYRHDMVGAELTDVILRRLKFANEERELIVSLVKNHMFWYDAAWSDGTVRRFIGRVGEENLGDLFQLRAADIVARGRGEDPATELHALETRVTKVLSESRALKVTDLAIDGGDVMRELNLPPSRQVREALESLLELVLEEPGMNEREKLLEVLRKKRPLRNP